MDEVAPMDATKFVLVGDFNINFNSESSPLKVKLLQLMYKYNLAQVIDQPTRYAPTGTMSTIDLVLLPNLSMCSNVELLPPLSTSDHFVISLSLSLNSIHLRRRKQETRTLWMYGQADFDLARALISSIDWDAICMISDEVEASWHTWKLTFMNIMKTAIPHRQITMLKNLPWITYGIVKFMQKRDRVVCTAKRSGSAELWNKYKQIRNLITRFKHAKRQFFQRLNHTNPNKILVSHSSY